MKKIVINYFLACVSCIILWNLIIGNFVYNQSSEIETSIGGAKVPNSRYVSNAEGFVDFTMDNYGFNNDHIEMEKGDKYRIIVLGDSMTEAAQIPREYNYSKQLEKNLNNNGKKQYEVFNFGRGGRAVPDYIYFSDGYNKFSPDFVVIGVSVSDITGDGNYMKVVKNSNGKYEIINNLKDDFFQKFKYLKDKTGWFKPIVGHSLIKLKDFVTNIPFLKNENKNINTAEASKEDVATDNKSKLIDFQIKELVNKFGKNIVLVYLSEVPTIRNGEIQKETDNDVSNIKKIITEKCNQYKIGFIDTTNSFVNFYEANNEMPSGFNNSEPGQGHLNKNGHKIVADELYNYFLERGIVKK